MGRIEIPDRPAGWVPRKGRAEPHDSLRDTLEGVAMAWGGLVAGDPDRLRGLAIVSTFLDGMLEEEVASRRDEGCSWAEIGASLGITKQAAQQRYGKAD